MPETRTIERVETTVEHVTFEGDEVFVDDVSWRAPYPIVDLRRVGDVIAVIYDHFAGPNWHQFQNLQGFSLDGHKLWTAEHPTTEATDSYVAFLNVDGLVAWNYACYICTLDPATGRLLSTEFTK